MERQTQERIARLEHDWLRERQARQALGTLSLHLNSVMSLRELLTMIVTTACTLLDAESGALLLLDETTDALTFPIAIGRTGAHVQQLQMPAEDGVAGWVLLHGEALVVDNVPNDARFYNQIDATVGQTTQTLLAVPLTSAGKRVGVLELINKQAAGGFTSRDLGLATALGAQMGVALGYAGTRRQSPGQSACRPI